MLDELNETRVSVTEQICSKTWSEEDKGLLLPEHIEIKSRKVG